MNLEFITHWISGAHNRQPKPKNLNDLHHAAVHHMMVHQRDLTSMSGDLTSMSDIADAIDHVHYEVREEHDHRGIGRPTHISPGAREIEV